MWKLIKGPTYMKKISKKVDKSKHCQWIEKMIFRLYFKMIRMIRMTDFSKVQQRRK